MDANHFVASRLETGGYTWTLVTRLGVLLERAERLYGVRDRGWTILGVEFGPGVSRVWYPGNRGHVAVQLSASGLDDSEQARYLLAHECIHLLSPTGGGLTNVLEEGLATHFADAYMNEKPGRDWSSTDANYRSAAADVSALLSIDPQAVVKLRAVARTFPEMTMQHFAAVCPSAPEDLARRLLAPFNYGAA